MSGIQIENAGTGGRFGLKVNEAGQASTFSVTEPEDKHVNRDGRTWTLYLSKTPVGTDDYIFYIKNTGSDALAITDIRALAGAATTLHIDQVSGTPSYAAGADITPAPRNGGSNKTPTATIKSDTNTTGLTVVHSSLFPVRCDTADKLAHLSSSSNIVIPQGSAYAIRSSAAVAVEMWISLTGLDV